MSSYKPLVEIVTKFTS